MKTVNSCQKVFIKHLQVLIFSLLPFFLFGCTVVNLAVQPYDRITLIAEADVNPDIDDRPSPVHVKILHLSSRATFDNLGFEQIYYHADTLLRGELIVEESFLLQPNETIEQKLLVDKGTKFVAIVAAFRDIENAEWRTLMPISDKYYYSHTYKFSRQSIIPISRNHRALVHGDKISSIDQPDSISFGENP